jgi:hypothetical protein
MSNIPTNEGKPAKEKKKPKKKLSNFNNFKVDFDLNLNKSFNSNDILKKNINILPTRNLNKRTKGNETHK